MSDPLPIDSSHVKLLEVAITAGITLVVGVVGTIIAFLRMGKKQEEGESSVAKTLEVRENKRLLEQVEKNTVAFSNRQEELHKDHIEHEKLVTELHKFIIDAQKEVDRRMLIQDIEQVKNNQNKMLAIMEVQAKALKDIADSTSIMARKLRELAE